MGKSKSAIGLLATLVPGVFLSTVCSASPDSIDYVIVGGGPAGVVLAESLSRDGSKQVILLEAGKETYNSTIIDSRSPAPGIGMKIGCIAKN